MVQVSVIRWILSGFTLSIEEEGLRLWDNYESCIVEAKTARGTTEGPGG